MRFNGTALPISTQPVGVPQIGQLVADEFGPGGILQAVNNVVNAVVLQVSLIAGQSYLINARMSGTIITTNPNYVWARIGDSANLIQTYPVYFMSLSSAAYAVGNVICGACSTVIVATSSVTDTIAMNVSASGSGGLQMATNSCELSVVRIA